MHQCIKKINKMILTEIKVKHLNVRISEFEDPIFDKNILPIFTTPLILKEVAARKRSKYKIETLNPEKKLTFRVVSFNEIVEQLASKINKIAVDLEPYYYVDPSNYNSLPNKVKEIMDKYKLIEEKKEIEDASFRIKWSTIKKKKLILYARSRNKNILKPILKKKDILNYRNFNFELNNYVATAPSPDSSVRAITNTVNNNLLLFAGWIPTSKGALMLLEDEGWDLDLLSNRNNISHRIRKLRPYKLKMLRRLRRLRRLRLMSTNLYLHRSKNLERILKDQECQGRNNSMMQYPINLNNNYLIKHSDNKLKFIVNWIGDNLNETTQRLDKKNKCFVSDISLMMQNLPTQLPSIEKIEEVKPLIDKKQEMLDQITLFKTAKAKADAAKIAHINSMNKRAEGLLNIKMHILKKKKKGPRYLNNEYFNYGKTRSTLGGNSIFSLTSENRAINRKFTTLASSNYSISKLTNLCSGNIATINIFNQFRNASNVAPNNLDSIIKNKNLKSKSATRISQSVKSTQSVYSLELRDHSIKSKFKAYPFLQHKNYNLIIRLKDIESKINNWNKKKNLLTEFLNNTSLRYVNSQLKLKKNNIFSEEYYSFNSKQKKLVKEKLSKVLYNNYLNKLRLSANPKAWKKIATLLKPSTNSRSAGYGSVVLFWAIIKLYSSSFNPMLNSLDNKYLTVPGFLGQGSAQIKIYKNSNQEAAINPTASNMVRPQLTINNNSITEVQLNNVNSTNSFKFKNIIKPSNLNLQQADNKRFLFLYFILPIFFSTSAAMSTAGQQQNNIFNNQVKQLRSLIKLMLNSGSSTNDNLKLITPITTPVNNLLKWSISFIAQSLTPLKREHDYYNLIFIKILKNRGFLSLNNKTKNVAIFSKENLTGVTRSTIISKSKEAIKGFSELEPRDIQGKFSLTKNNTTEITAADRLNNNKQTLITYYPGGRYISDWKRITKTIWQEDYKFNALYRRVKISLNLANNNTNKNFKNLYAIITILKLWEIIKITKIKFVSSFKLQGLFLNNPIRNKKNTFTAQIVKLTNAITQQINLSQRTQLSHQFIRNPFALRGLALGEEKFKYSIIKFILKVLDKLQGYQPSRTVLNQSSHHFNSAGAQGRFSSISNNLLLNNVKLNSDFASHIVPNSKLLNLSNKLITRTIKEQFSLIDNLSLWTKFRNDIRLSRVTTPYYLNYNLTRIINYLYNFSTRKATLPAFSHNLRTGVVVKSITKKIVEQTANSLIPNIEVNKSFNNLVNAKSIIIGKIRSIKLIELIDNLKEEIAIAEKLAALVRVADITDLNLINKKKSRRINSNKYLNKKNIYRSNRIKILQTIETIKTDFRFESKLDSNSLSNIPVPLLYYSNLKPVHLFKDNKSSTAVNTASINKDSNINNLLEKPPVISAYLRELSIYNRETKGIINYFSKIIGYNFNTNNNKISSSVYELLEASFNAMRCLISKPVFIITPEKITIQLFYFLLVANKNKLKKIRNKFGYRRKRKTYNKNRLKEAKKLNLYSLNEVFPEQLELLCGRLNKVFNKPVELNLIRLHYPSEDTNILVNLMGIIINKIHLAKIFRKLFAGSIIKTLTKIKTRKYNDISIIPAFLTGLNIKVAGRIMTQTMRPRHTINLRRRGATANGKINYLNFARLTNKNKRGSYSITISAGQNYFK